MKCTESVIVTLKFQSGSGSLDIEIPSFMPIGQLKEKLLETLRVMNPAYESSTALRLSHNDRELTEGTPASLGIWDGSILVGGIG